MSKLSKRFLLFAIVMLGLLSACQQTSDSFQAASSNTTAASLSASAPDHSLSSLSPNSSKVPGVQTSTLTTPSVSVTTILPTVTTASPVTVDITTALTTESLPPVTESVEPNDDEMVSLSAYLPEVKLDIRYATENNFTGQVIYEHSDAYLRYGTVKKLRKASDMLAEEGYMLLIWDAWRPAEAQWKLWEICPDANYVSNPNKGYSSHTRGGTVDLSLLDIYGNEVTMPTDFDDFSAAADRDYREIETDAAEHARLLESVMIACGFTPYQKEWWHYTDQNSWDVLEKLSEASFFSLAQ